MGSEITELISISNLFIDNKNYLAVYGSSISYKDPGSLYIKANGVRLSSIDADGFVKMDRKCLDTLLSRKYRITSDRCETEVKNEMFNSRVEPEKGLPSSIESPLHNIIPYRFVAHIHTAFVNAIMCSTHSESVIREMFGDKALYIPYCNPDYTLYKKVEEAIADFTQRMKVPPKIIFLQNYGVLVGADTTKEIVGIYEGIEGMVKGKFNVLPETIITEHDAIVGEVIPAIRMLLSRNRLKIAGYFDNTLIRHFTKSQKAFKEIDNCLTPNEISCCHSASFFIESTQNTLAIIEEFTNKLQEFRSSRGFDPKVVFLKNMGMITIDDSFSMMEIVRDTFINKLKVTSYSLHFGGINPMTKGQVAFIDNREAEMYRGQVAVHSGSKGRVINRVAVVTGGAQGFGKGIVQSLHHEGANVVIADINKDAGSAYAKELNKKGGNNGVVFINTDISNADSVNRMVFETVCLFGGLDIFISNAGILHAGGLDEMTPEVFELMTKVNYSGYFLCVKPTSKIMKIQHKYNPGFFMDIIQVNSKSGLEGSNKNFAYAGGKFGGLGLTQSFAMELMPYNIKVNSICPGNFFDGPLWSDPQNGLFVQYLKTGKVPGAKTVTDVKKFYESRVPAGRGCTTDDVMKAVYYVIEQQYETGQAVPVTGGQNMLK